MELIRYIILIVILYISRNLKSQFIIPKNDTALAKFFINQVDVVKNNYVFYYDSIITNFNNEKAVIIDTSFITSDSMYNIQFHYKADTLRKTITIINDSIKITSYYAYDIGFNHKAFAVFIDDSKSKSSYYQNFNNSRVIEYPDEFHLVMNEEDSVLTKHCYSGIIRRKIIDQPVKKLKFKGRFEDTDLPNRSNCIDRNYNLDFKTNEGKSIIIKRVLGEKNILINKNKEVTITITNKPLNSNQFRNVSYSYTKNYEDLFIFPENYWLISVK